MGCGGWGERTSSKLENADLECKRDILVKIITISHQHGVHEIALISLGECVQQREKKTKYRMLGYICM